MKIAALAVVVATVAIAAEARAQTEDPGNKYQTTVHARPKRDDGYPVLVLTGRDLQERGAQNLKDALDLIPEVQVRQGGMGIRLDLRGAKQFSVLLLIDGVPVDEPYNGAFDVSSIPITDIVEIRVQLAPASPLEGPGGDGGIVEVFTLHANGGKRIDARVSGGSLPEADAAVTGRTPLNRADTWALRASAGGHFWQPTYPVVAPDMSQASFPDRDYQAYTALRIEYAKDTSHFTGDVWYGHRAFFIPPSDSPGFLLQQITGQDAARAVLGGEFVTRGIRLAFGAYGEIMSQATDSFADYTLKTKVTHQDLLSGRLGAAAHLDKPLAFRGVKGVLSARLSLDGEGASIDQTNAKPTWGLSTYAEAAIGARLAWWTFTFEAAAGVALPFASLGATWPEGKVVVGWKPNKWISLLLIGARKGRVPTIRELYDPVQGNVNLHPEQAWHGELQIRITPHRLVAARLNGYLRQIDGAIRASNPGDMSSRNINLDTIYVRGLETGIDVARDKIFGGGLTYIFEEANSPTLGFNPIQQFPRHKVDVYLSTTFYKKRFGAIARFRWVTENMVQNQWLPRYQTVQLFAWGKIWRNLRASVRVDNVIDASYQLLPGLNALGPTVTATVEGTWE